MLALALLLAAVPPPTDAPAPADPPPALDAGRRRLVEVGLTGGLAQDFFIGRCRSLAGGPPGGCGTSVQGSGIGPYLRGGIQIDDRWGFAIEASFGTILSAGYGRAVAAAAATFADWFTLSLGPVVSGVVAPGKETAAAVGASVRGDFHLWRGGDRRGRSAFTLGVAVDGGATVAGTALTATGPAVGGYATAGWAWY